MENGHHKYSWADWEKNQGEESQVLAKNLGILDGDKSEMARLCALPPIKKGEGKRLDLDLMVKWFRYNLDILEGNSDAND
jgi:hypothetical protein